MSTLFGKRKRRRRMGGGAGVVPADAGGEVSSSSPPTPAAAPSLSGAPPRPLEDDCGERDGEGREGNVRRSGHDDDEDGSEAGDFSTSSSGGESGHSDDGEDSSDQRQPRRSMGSVVSDDEPATRPAPTKARNFAELGLSPALVSSCRRVGFGSPTPVQRMVIPAVLEGGHVLALAATGSGKTAAYVLPILETLSVDPYGIYAVVLCPTRELALQVHEQVLALGSNLRVRSVLVTGGTDQVRQSCELARRPHMVVATPGRLGYLLRGPSPPNIRNVRYVVLDEADRLLSPGGFERDVAEVLLSASPSNLSGGGGGGRSRCQTLLFSATMTASLDEVSALASGGRGRLPLRRICVEEDVEVDADGEGWGGEDEEDWDDGSSSTGAGSSSDGSGSESDDGDQSAGVGRGEDRGFPSNVTTAVPRIPPGLRHEYVFMPSRVRDAYAVATLRAVMEDEGRRRRLGDDYSGRRRGDGDGDDRGGGGRARSAILFVSTCERAARIDGVLTTLGMDCVALHGLLSQDRRAAALGKFKSSHVRMLVATDVASRGLDIPEVDLVLNIELPRNAEDYVHRCGRTARAGRRGLAISLVGERDVALVHAAEKLAGRPMKKCERVTDEEAVRVLGSVTKATRLAKMKLMEVGFDDLVRRRIDRRARDRKERLKAKRAAEKIQKKRKRGVD